MVELLLNWAGPFSLRTPESRQAFRPPSEPGVYIWTVGTRRALSYVGQAADLRARLYQHIHNALGGAYWIYEREYFEGRTVPSDVSAYEPEPATFNQRFLDEFDRLSQLALLNLTSFEMYWAVVEGGRQQREEVESAYIAWAREQSPRVVQNEALSRAGDASNPLLILSSFEGEAPQEFPRKLRWPTV
ncbi:MAG TPA: GIY-YIG nuclease family protein [Planctomycetota bacterium]|nr:GIY-YIG nuclease family protein [Planctomycetota bacterium]